ncbi:HNH endonuclease [Polyangium mundeleinium]|uniref:HNH endonuclease signature motif containing protein n=1 Tax=Polyangium mundeleinium TaxID=2995306 RepID=A0ABT5ELG8_9BACT|nr:HNH endonuclease signature motif containing protein [Polyangium mundeleinium]MDC0742038.1 HNH endonuclease signature motif containing protein [Polyangium mundeleinium]
MTSRRALVPSLHLRLWMLGALRFFRVGLLGLVAFGVSAWLLGCGAARVHTEGWAQELHGKSVFRVCRRHPRVGPNARHWYELGDGVPRPAFEPLEKLLENPSVKAVFIHDPHAPIESRRLLGLAYQDLPCDKPPPPPPPPPEKIAAKEPEAEPAKRTTVRTETRTSAIRPCERPRNGPPDQRFLGQTAPTPAPAPGMSAPCPPPPPGNTYEEQKVNLARRDAEEEARRTGERIGREWGATLGGAAEAASSLNRSVGGGRPFDVALWNNPAGADKMRADVARQLNAIPDLPTYDDEQLAKIAWEGFLKGYGKGWADAEAKYAIVNALADTLLTLATAGAGALETAGARALRAAQQRLRSMPVFLPAGAGGPGGFLRRPKLPSPPAPSPPKAVAPPNGTTVTTTTKPVTATPNVSKPNGAQSTPVAAQGNPPSDKRRFTPSDRAKGLERAKDADGVPHCTYCGKELDPKAGKPNSYEPDHRIPHVRGGPSTPDNLVPSCRTCNRSKGAKTPEEWKP